MLARWIMSNECKFRRLVVSKAHFTSSINKFMRYGNCWMVTRQIKLSLVGLQTCFSAPKFFNNTIKPFTLCVVTYFWRHHAMKLWWSRCCSQFSKIFQSYRNCMLDVNKHFSFFMKDDNTFIINKIFVIRDNVKIILLSRSCSR